MKKIISVLVITLILFGVAATQQKAVHFKKLQEFLPEKITGFDPDKPQGSSSTVMGMSTSEASIEFTNESGDQLIEIKISDISGMPHAGMAMAYQGMDYENEDENGYEKTITLDSGYKAIEKAQTTGYLSCELELILGGRFSINISGKGFSDAKILHEVMKDIDLKKLETTKAE